MSQMENDQVRVDKWLWAIRFYKTRSLASDACASGRVKINGDSIKASRTLKGGEILNIKKGQITYTVKVIELIEKRVGAPLAIKAYEDLPPEEEMNKHKDPLAPTFYTPSRARGTGRPTKKERRDLDSFKDR